MNGTVTISLADFKKLQDAAVGGNKIHQEAVDLKREVDRVLSFINQSVDMGAIAKEYNQLSDSTGEIIVDRQICTLIRKVDSK